MAKIIKEFLIQALAGGTFVSGQSLAEQLNISRTAIAKHIKSLSEMGLDIYRVTGKGYKLAVPIALLDEKLIISNIAEQGYKIPVAVHHIIDSTNNYLIRKLPNNVQHGQVCIAEYQSAGRGRRGRQWISPFGSHIYLSMYWHLEQGMSMAMGLNIVCALALADAVKQLYKVDVQLKWPNDIYLADRKLAGILIDLEGQPLEDCHCVIGIGLNVLMPKASEAAIDQPWSDLQSHITDSVDRNKLAAVLITCLYKRLLAHKEQGLVNMLTEWHQRDIFLNKRVKVLTGNKQTIGWCRGIDQQGALLLQIDDKITTIYGGEVSLRSANEITG